MRSNFELDDDTGSHTVPRLRPEGRPWAWATAAAALVGAIFAAVSTHDFISHLDRQAHSIHCSLLPGAGASIGETGCRTVLMSPYSSLFRTELWGGLPISLLAFAVFAYLVYRAAAVALEPRLVKRDTGYLWLATGLPVLTSVVYGIISSQVIGTICQVCLGIYITSFAGFVFAGLAHRSAEPTAGVASPWPLWGRWFAEGVLAVGLLAGVYVGFAPEEPDPDKSCGVLAKPEDPNRVLVPSAYGSGTKAVMVLDPLCPACRGFERRLAASGLGDGLDMEYLLFPLDARCNWMLSDSLHPGACAVSEAILCAPDDAERVLAWAFDNQEDLLEMGADSDRAVREQIVAKFPKVRGCLGKNAVKAKLRKSLRWAVANAIPVLTPQLFVDGRRMCDEDTDLGLEYSLTEMLAEAKGAKR